MDLSVVAGEAGRLVGKSFDDCGEGDAGVRVRKPADTDAIPRDKTRRRRDTAARYGAIARGSPIN